MRRIVPLVLAAAAATACDPTGNIPSSPPTADVRFINLVEDAPTIDVLTDGLVRLSAVPFGSAGENVSINTADRLLEIRNSADNSSLRVDTIALNPVSYTYYALGKITGYQRQILADGTVPADSGKIRFRFVHGIVSRSTVSLDLYLSLASDSLTAISPTLSATPYGSASGYVQADTGRRRLRLTVASQKTAIFDTTFATAIPDSTVLTIVGSDQSGGALPIRLQYVVDRAP